MELLKKRLEDQLTSIEDVIDYGETYVVYCNDVRYIFAKIPLLFVKDAIWELRDTISKVPVELVIG